MKRAVLYLRVSTADQNTENQLPDLQAYCKFREWIIADTFRDEAVSGTKETRPALEKMMAAIRAGKYDVLLVWSYDRFARSLSHLVTTLDHLRSLNVDFASYRERLDTTTPEGRMMFGFYGVMAEFERNRMATRTRATLARLKAQGKKLGRPTEGDIDLRQRVHMLRNAGSSLRDIAFQVAKSKSWVSDVLKTPLEFKPTHTV